MQTTAKGYQLNTLNGVIVALAPTLAVLVSAWLAQKSRNAIAKETKGDVAEVKTIVNGHTDAISTRLAEANKEIGTLKEEVGGLKVSVDQQPNTEQNTAESG